MELIPGQKAEIEAKCNEVKTALALIIAVESESKEYASGTISKISDVGRAHYITNFLYYEIHMPCVTLQ
jgi:hypothetical protein